jgi:AcrR family transcriptional regulator
MTKTAPRRREREIERTRADIMLAAARAFSRSGYAGATMQDIAREAGFTAASLYTYFPGKQEIFEGLLTMLHEEFEATFRRETPESLSFQQQVELQMRHQFELIESRRDIFSMLFTLWPGKGQDLPLSGKACPHHPFELRVTMTARWIAKAASPADLHGRDPLELARFLVGAVFALVHGWAQEGMKTRLTDLVPHAMDLLFYGISGRKTAPGGRRK